MSEGWKRQFTIMGAQSMMLAAITAFPKAYFPSPVAWWAWLIVAVLFLVIGAKP